MGDLRDEAERYLRRALGRPDLSFRDGQWEAIRTVVEARARLLVVQRTGWGKSMVYFLATRLLRDRGYGPTLLVSPLLALMRNQVEAAERLGIRAETINSTNRDAWEHVEAALRDDAVDVLLISPERLANPSFRERVLAHVAGRVGLFVVDEAHCISDWGHDFRPDYRRIVRILAALPPGTPVLATTATANNRVVDDIVAQLGADLRVMRGPLARASLRLQATTLPSQAERMAWLAARLPEIAGSGIVYARTVADAEQVAAWLQEGGVDAHAYYGALPSERREALEQQLLRNEVKALVATSALGMGFDKPDLAFVVHYQRPGSVVEYYQQVGRAGRDGTDAYGVLLCGAEDDEITEYFIRSAFPPAEHVDAILRALEAAPEGLRLTDFEHVVNLSRSQIAGVLRNLDAASPAPIRRDADRYYRTTTPYTYDEAHVARLMAIRRAEQEELRTYAEGHTCHMAYLRARLDDADVAACGRCAVDAGGPLLPAEVDNLLVHRALHFLQRAHPEITPRRQAPNRKRIPDALQAEAGRALCRYGDAGWGRLVRDGRERAGHYDDALVEAAAEMILGAWRPAPSPAAVVAVPSLRRPVLVPSFAERLAGRLGLPCVAALEQVRATAPQEEMNNSHHRLENLRNAFAVELPPALRGRDLLLIDDLVDSGWTLTYLTALLRQHGAGRVHPVALAMATGG